MDHYNCEHTASGFILIWTSERHDVFVFSLLPLQWLGSGLWWIAQKREVLQGKETQKGSENIIIPNPHPRIITGNSYITILDMLLSSIFCMNCQMQSNIPLWHIYFYRTQMLSYSQPFLPPCVFCFGMNVYAIVPLGGSGEHQTAGINKHGDHREGYLTLIDFFELSQCPGQETFPTILQRRASKFPAILKCVESSLAIFLNIWTIHSSAPVTFRVTAAFRVLRVKLKIKRVNSSDGFRA